MTGAGIAPLAIWGITALTLLAILVRPGRLAEAWYALAGAVLLVAAGLIPPGTALRAVLKGYDVYLFLLGMMLLAEAARSEGLFDWLAVRAVRLARGSPGRLFTLVYLVGVGVTALLSNDATAVVLTPAVLAAARAAGAEPLPYLLICAFVANAASFVLPISNPANLVVYGQDMPPLGSWVLRFGLPSLLAIVATYVALRITQRAGLREAIRTEVPTPVLSVGGRLAAAGLLVTALLLTGASAAGFDLGLPTFLAGLGTALIIPAAGGRAHPVALARHVDWSILPLVAGLFVLVGALEQTGLLQDLSAWLRASSHASPKETAWLAGGGVALLTNLVNNLPAGLLAGAAVAQAGASDTVGAALLIGVDLGPNLSVTGSLATLLWLAALRRGGLHMSGLAFFRLGLVVMPPALILALLGLLAVPS